VAVICAPIAALVSVVLGLIAAIRYGLVDRQPTQQALAGLLAVVLSTAGAMFVWGVFIADLRGMPLW
jgi:hypothetical protein